MDKMVKKKRKRSREKNIAITIISGACLVVGLVVGIVISLILFKTDGNGEKDTDSAGNKVAYNEKHNNLQAYEIETPYCTLYYPNQWEDEIEIEQIEDEVYIVRFSVILEGKGKQQLFDIVFNVENQDIGYFDTKDGKVNVDMISVDVPFDDTWTEGEKNRIYAMQEEANFVLEMLKEQEGFVEY